LSDALDTPDCRCDRRLSGWRKVAGRGRYDRRARRRRVTCMYSGNVIVGFLLFHYFVFVTNRGELPRYMGFFVG